MFYLPPQVEELLDGIRQDCDMKKLTTECENRATPLKNSELEMTRRKYLKLSKSPKLGDVSDSTDESKKLKSENKSEKTVQRQLYDLLFSPVEDILSKLPKESPLIIVPDKALHHCPFNVLHDFLNRYAFKRFSITYLPNILLLDKVVSNELNQLRLKDDLHFQRQVHRKGGMSTVTNRVDLNDDSRGSAKSVDLKNIDPKKISHPRLLTRPLHTPMVAPKPGMLPKERTMYDEEFRQHSQWLTPRSHRGLTSINLFNYI